MSSWLLVSLLLQMCVGGAYCLAVDTHSAGNSRSAGDLQYASSSDCMLESYDLGPLASQEAWILNRPCVNADTDGKGGDVSEDLCSYYFSVCHALPAISEPSEDFCHGSAVCAYSDKVQNQTGAQWQSLGSFENYNGQALPNYPEFNIVYHKDGNRSSQCHTMLTFRCNESISWTDTSGRIIEDVPEGSLISMHFDPPCSYILQFQYDRACHTQIPSTSSKLSAGSYAVIVVTCVLLLYVVAGVTYQALRGHRGWDLIPNRDAWNAVGAYVGGGIAVLLSPCRGPRTTDSSSTSSSQPPADDGKGEKTRLLT
eukprot:scpid72265/ scgid9221/ 